jgi:hypothetical protein
VIFVACASPGRVRPAKLRGNNGFRSASGSERSGVELLDEVVAGFLRSGATEED